VLGGGTSFSGNTLALNTAGATFLNGASASESFSFNLYANGSAQTVTATVNGAAGGITASNVLSQLNSTLSSYGITAGLDSKGALEFSGSTAFNVTDSATTPGLISPTATATANNSSNFIANGQTTFSPVSTAANSETLTFQTGGQTVSVSLSSTTGDTVADAIKAINSSTSQFGIYAVENSAGTGIDFQGSSNFTVKDAFTGGTAGVFSGAGSTASTAPTTSDTTNATTAITAINSAIAALGLVQGVVGAAENTLNYAINLAQSQITNFSSADANIKDADIATQAANLSKSQVLTQTAVAALAQANSEPQAILKLLQ
jgi:flagellin